MKTKFLKRVVLQRMEKSGVKNEKVGQRSREEERRAELKRRELEDDEVG